jgi:hypothetical protein
MSVGALLQLQSKNEFDDLLFGTDIKMSEFKSTYNKITNFAETPYSFNPTSSVSWGDRITFKINKIGDLMTNMYLALELPEIKVSQIIGKNEDDVTSNYRVKWLDYIGYVIIEHAILRIGGKIIQEMTGEYMMCYTNLYDNNWCNLKLIGHDGDLNKPQLKIISQYIYVPLRFFNCGCYNNALPVNALRYHEIEVEIKLRKWDEVYFVLYQLLDVKDEAGLITDPDSYKYAHTHNKLPQFSFNNIRLDCNFVFLDPPEREYFLQNKLEMLITQVQSQHQTITKTDSIYIDFYNPMKELYFVISKSEIKALGELFNYSGKPAFIPFDANNNEITQFTKALWVQIPEKHILLDANLQFNGVDRVPWKDYKYWYLVQNYETFKSRPEHYIYLYSFGLNSKKNMGSCNFSVLDSVKFNIKLASSDIRRFSLPIPEYNIELGPESSCNISVYGTSYNVLIIEDGLSELMFGM